MLVFGWIVGALAVGFAGSQRGRSGLGWFVLSLLLSPLLGVLLLLACPARGRVAGAFTRLPQAGSQSPWSASDVWPRSVALAVVFGVLALLAAAECALILHDVGGAVVSLVIGAALLIYAQRRRAKVVNTERLAHVITPPQG